MIITFHKDFVRDFKKLPPKTKEKFYERLSFFKKDEFNPALNNHSLKGKYLGYRSINVTGDLRTIFKKNGDKVMFMEINSHSNLYG